MINPNPVENLNQEKSFAGTHESRTVVCYSLARVFNGHKRVHPQERAKDKKGKSHRQADTRCKSNGIITHTLAIWKGRGVEENALRPAINQFQAGVVHPIHLGLPDLVALAVAAPRSVHGLEHFDRKNAERNAKNIHKDTGSAPKVVVGHEIVNAQRVTKDRIETKEAQQARVCPCADAGVRNNRNSEKLYTIKRETYSGGVRGFSSVFS